MEGRREGGKWVSDSGDRGLHICRMLISCKNSVSAKRKSANPPKMYGPKIANCHICGKSENLKEVSVRKMADLQFAELICGPPIIDSKY
jgi:hypothetical protein